jgi:hypothetical protein
MSSASGSTDWALRTRRTVSTAAEAGRELGLVVNEPQVLHDMFSVVVHLAPSPVVVRAPVVLPFGLGIEALVARQRRELLVVSWLAGRGYPVVRPSPLVPLEPVQRDGLSMTFWELVDVARDEEPDYVADAALAAELHAALRDYPAELPFLLPITLGIPSGLARLEGRPELLAAADLERAQRHWAVLEPVLSSRAGFTAVFPDVSVQPIHGDAPSYNLIRTRSGIRYADFEDVTLGPAEWDLSLFGSEAAARYDAAAARAGLRTLNPDVLRVMDAAGLLRVVASMAFVPELPELATALLPFLERWRATPLSEISRKISHERL